MMCKGFVALCILLSSTFASASNVPLSWDYTPNADPQAGFRIFRQTSPAICNGTWAVLTDVGPTLRTFTDSTAVGNTQYCYYMTAVDASGFQSLPSNTFTVAVPAVAAPMALATSSVQAASIGFTWAYTANITPQTGFRMFRQAACTGAFTLLTPDLAANAVSMT